MSAIFVHGFGAVSPVGWGVQRLRDAIAANQALPTKELARPGWNRPLRVRPVPPPSPRPECLLHPRLRRTSPLTQYGVAAAFEALGDDAAKVRSGSLRLGLIFCVMAGCVNHSRRFYDETLRDPATASPLIFPETVFNAPASHLAAVLGTTAINYTLVGDPGTFLQGLALGAQWLSQESIDGCAVVGAEEMDWLTADAFRLFHRDVILSEGAGAVYLRREPTTTPAIELRAITEPYLYGQNQTRNEAAVRARRELPPGSGDELLCDSAQAIRRLDAAESSAWADWRGARISSKKVLSEGLMAAAAWQCIVAIDALKQGRHSAANVSVVGCNQQAIGARFEVSH
jgi:hypothetical protein